MNGIVVGLRTRFARLTVLCIATALTLLSAQLVLAAPDDPDFKWSPASPQVGEPVTFTAEKLKQNSSVGWDFDNNGTIDATGATAQHVFATPGQKTVRMRVTRPGDQATEVVHTITVTPAPPPPNQPPVASFTATPNPAQTGQPVSFDASGSSDDGGIVKYEWDLDGNGSYETDTGTTPTTSASYASAGSYAVKLRVTDNQNATGTNTVLVTVNAPPNQPPTAAFTASPNPAITGQTVGFNASGSSDPDGSIVKYEWDLDGNGSYETDTGTTPTTSASYSTPNTYAVKLRVTDNRNASDTQTVLVIVSAPSSPPPPPPNQFPTARVTAKPNPAQTGETVAFDGSGSSDPDGSIARYEWDLDGNGSYETNTGTTPTASKSYSTPGTYTVTLKVTDDKGGTDTQQIPVVVTGIASPLSATPQPIVAVVTPSVASGPELLSPFPVVRLVGRVTRAGTQVRFLAVRGPRGSRVTVRCSGRGCTFRNRSKLASLGRVRFGFRRILRPGARIAILVTKPNKIGKYTLFVIRRRRPPVRRDRCVWPGVRRPRSCPSS